MKHPSLRVATGSALGALAAGALVLSSFPPATVGQPAPAAGIRENVPRWHALVGATVVPAPGERIDNATVVVRDGVIVSVRPGGRAPAGARVWDYTGLTIYPGFIEPHLPVSAPAPDENAPGNHWNAKVTPQRSALTGSGPGKSEIESLRKIGFAAAAIAPKDGVLRGSSAVVLLEDPGAAGSADMLTVVRDGAYHSIAFETGGFGRPAAYPGSKMGAIALVRQTFSDADWRAETLAAYSRNPSSTEPPKPMDALDAIGPRHAGGMFLFNTQNEQDAPRAAKLAAEFGRSAALLGSGTEFRRLADITATGLPIVLPLAFPKAPTVDTIADQNDVTLRDLMTWEQAPTNPRRLAAAGVAVSLTTDKLPRGQKFFDNLRSAIRHGLSESDALAMLTTNPADLLGVGDRLGRVAPGYLANFVVTDGSIFDTPGKVRDVWVAGERHEIEAAPAFDPSGAYAAVFTADAETHTSTLTIKDKNKLTFDFDEHKNVKARKVELNHNRFSFLLDGEDFGSAGVYAVSGVFRNGSVTGVWKDPDGGVFTWRADLTSAGADDASADKKKSDDEPAPDLPEALPLPFGAYGFLELPAQEDVIVTNATIWTAGPRGIIENGTLVVSNGKIIEVTDRPYQNVIGMRVIDANGKHVPPGLIDAHSHTAITGGVNEGTHAVTSEVRIADVIDPDDIDLWRELAGGLTMANQLHGSANPIGGQNSVVKLRWGATTADELLLDGAPSGIKFALGENVKQSNWGERFTTRYPQTRMGVETIIRDRFIAAREYAAEHQRYSRLSSTEKANAAPPRRDYQLDALVEILDGERLVHCHSYRQDEILMLARVARDFGFKIGTFQHVLEGYKVAEAIKESAIGASTFSDWWAYKFEVIDAIPDNGAIMHEVGVNVTFNSDSNELARRMNTEAGKAVKYGKVDPAEALKFVTYNAALQLGIEDLVGSLEAGKDADFVIWSGDPLSYFSRAERTFVDGRELFSIERDAALRDRDRAEKQRIIQKILAKKGSTGAPADKPAGAQAATVADADRPDHAHAAEHELELERAYELLRHGGDLSAHRCGECGVGHNN